MTVKNQDDYEFDGYNELAYTPIPDEFFDWQMQDLNLSEMRVLLYIFRRTFGFKKHQDHISLSQFTDGICKRSGEKLDNGCGASRQSITSAIDGLIERGYINAQMYCRCGRMIETEEMEQESRTQSNNGNSHTYLVAVVPQICPQCGKKLRGREERWFSLMMNKGGVRKNFTRGYVKTLRTGTQEIYDTRNSIQDTVDKKSSAAAEEKTPEETLEEYFGPREEPPPPQPSVHWADRIRNESWRGWSCGNFAERDGVSAASQERVGALLERYTGERPKSDGQWNGWINTVIEIYKAAGGNWDAIERGISTAASYDAGFVPHIASRKGDVNGWVNAVARAASDRKPTDPVKDELEAAIRGMEADPQYQSFG